MPIQVLMPALSPTMTEGKLAKWLKNEGDAVSAGDALCEIETDKATMEVEAVDEGTLGKILVAEGVEGIAVNTPIAVILAEGEDASALQGMAAAPAPAPPAPPEPAAAPAATPPAPASPAPAAPTMPVPGGGERIMASPLARRMAEKTGLDLVSITGSGPHNRIVKRDVEAALAGGAAAPAAAPATPRAAPTAIPATRPDAAFTEIPNTTMRKIVAERLSASKRDIPHFYLSIDCDVDALLALRKDLNAKSPQGESAYKLSVNDFIVRAVALALRQVPAANATWTDEAVLRYTAIDVSVAVATAGGLITPIIRDADNKGLAAISNEMKDLAERARDAKLMPEEYQGGGFTISNLGMFGIKEFAAVINPPQSCILAIGKGEQRPVVKDGALAIATMMTCTLSVDHRSVDGAVGANFLAAFQGLIEEPLTMLL
ncbi:MAG: pyruvate dehydrogenase complex dihydrolipoamide acetyltransferase [Rhodospirillales bacterium]|jgi:pyruvate dehydrogenase E2 component (dihydrolipoamide acetyltransferase)|nr:pyruvate dehydrogenase complex dihydrolipoamide acetyltransferase [Rhodospirillales bacterium]